MSAVTIDAARTRRAARAIPWQTYDLAQLSTTQRQRLGRDWRGRMEQEHLAVGAFAMMTCELAEVGAPPDALQLVARAAADEVRHAEICRRLAQAALGERDVPARLRGVPRIPSHTDKTLHERALLHAVEMCCIGETCTGVYLTQMHENARGAARTAIASLLEDEIDHGRVGWALLAGANHELRACVAAELFTMLERAVGRVLAARGTFEKIDVRLAPFGYVAGEQAVALYADAMRDVVLPGFEAAGVETKPARAELTRRGWI